VAWIQRPGITIETHGTRKDAAQNAVHGGRSIARLQDFFLTKSKLSIPAQEAAIARIVMRARPAREEAAISPAVIQRSARRPAERTRTGTDSRLNAAGVGLTGSAGGFAVKYPPGFTGLRRMRNRRREKKISSRKF